MRGSYTCSCHKGYYSVIEEPFNGSLVEGKHSSHFQKSITCFRRPSYLSIAVAWKDFKEKASDGYLNLYQCKKCAPGCETCSDDSPCLSNYNWGFRYLLLIASMICVCGTLIIMGLVYKYRKIRVFALASPTFLCITLCGCIIMYLEVIKAIHTCLIFNRFLPTCQPFSR